MKFYLDGQCNVSPCSVQVDGVSYYYTSTDCFPFVIYDDRVYFGTPGSEHGDLEAHLGISRGLITHEGRFYMKPGVLVFWNENRDITPENVRLVVGALKKRIGIKPNSIRLFIDCAYDREREYDGDLIVEMTPEEYLSHSIAGKNTDYFWDLYKKKNKLSDERDGTTQSGMSAKDVWRHYKYVDESKDSVRLNESDIREMVRKCVSLIREGADFNVRGVYHVSSQDFNEFQLRYDRFPCLFFSSKPIYLAGAHNLYVCNLSMHNPLVFDGGMSWSYPLWLYLSNRYGELVPQEEFTRERYDGYLGAPYEFWEMVYYDEDEYSSDQIPELVKRLNDEKGYNYDGVIIKGIDEGDRSDMVDDYVVFDPGQVQIVRRGRI